MYRRLTFLPNYFSLKKSKNFKSSIAFFRKLHALVCQCYLHNSNPKIVHHFFKWIFYCVYAWGICYAHLEAVNKRIHTRAAILIKFCRKFEYTWIQGSECGLNRFWNSLRNSKINVSIPMRFFCSLQIDPSF